MLLLFRMWVCCAMIGLLIVPRLHAQELQARVSVLTPTIQGVDREIINQLQRDITDYLNKTRFTTMDYQPIERIKCSFTITVNGLPSIESFECVTQVQVVRPVYRSTYETVILNFNDRLFNFNYVPFQQLQFSENAFVSNLTSLLNFWAYMIIGIDMDCMAPEGGTPYYARAQNQANLAQNNGAGWRAMDGNNTRYWLMENVLNNSYKGMRTALYQYHRKGLDIMSEDVAQGRSNIVQQMLEIQKVQVLNPQLYLLRVFFDSKKGELANLMKQATPEDKALFLRVMGQVDPVNLNEYSKINNPGP